MYSHQSYHLGNMLPIASMALGKRVVLGIATKQIPSNLYVMIAGISTISGKSFSSSTAIDDFGVATVNIPTLVNPSDAAHLALKTQSNPALIQELSRQDHLLWYFDEANEFFEECAVGRWNAPIIGTLCGAYDGSPVERNLSSRDGERNIIRCEKPFVNVLFNMTTSQLKAASTHRIVESGFFYRWLWFIEEGGERKKNVTATKEQLAETKAIRAELVRVGTMLKQLPDNSITFRVHDKIEEWALDISKQSRSEIFQGATGRGFIHIYKIAMIFAMFDPEFQKTVLNRTDYPQEFDLPDKWVDAAIKLEENYLLPRSIVVAEFADRVDVNNRQQKVLDALQSMGGVATHTELLKKTKLDRAEFAKAIDTLLESNEIARNEKINPQSNQKYNEYTKSPN